ncbi:hydantoinase B/oxoprolinase family protein [Phytohabitans kaempferiae]|uniref:Hydantoinase B/oxoprolinase family protein n=1 Tax=Phytohabitans kaempferiae TaxID=1620943 RepID=A0ABV6LYZ1_9ACTN
MNAADVDPVTFEVIRHRLRGITEEQAARIRTISGSKHVTEMSDYNVGLYLADGSVATMGRTILFHSSCMAAMVRHVIDDCAENPGIRPGDMFVVNNPWKGAVHGPDMAVVAPIFAGDRLVAWSGAMMHMADIGGLREGGMGLDATECYQEGLMMPPTKVVERGAVRRDIWNLILTHSRAASAMSLDLKGLIAANHAAADGFAKLTDRYGVDATLAVMAGLIRSSEERMRRRLRELPDATVRAVGYLEYDPRSGTVPEIVLELTKQGDRLTFDYSGSSPQAANSTNCTWAGLNAGIAAGMMPTIAYDIPWNEGLFRPVEVVCAEGRICNATMPAAVSSSINGATWEVELTTVAALSRLAACSDQYWREAQASAGGRPGSFLLYGTNNDGEAFTGRTYDMLATGAGAYGWHDGVYAQGHHNIERAQISNVENLELDMPILYLWRGLSEDGGGAGRHRGGLSVGSVYKGTERAPTVSGLGQSWDVPDSAGIFGGHPGAEKRGYFIRSSNVEQLLAGGRVPEFAEIEGERLLTRDMPRSEPLGPDAVLFCTMPSGAGWGDPLDRDVAAVREDVAARVVSVAAAWTIYGVVVDEDGRLDEAATEARRSALRGERRAWPAGRRAEPPAGALDRAGPFGDRLELARDAAGRLWVRCACSHVLAPADVNWREYAGRDVADPEEIRLGLRLNDVMEIRRYACPGCGRLHAVDVCKKDAPDPYDIRLADAGPLPVEAGVDR